MLPPAFDIYGNDVLIVQCNPSNLGHWLMVLITLLSAFWVIVIYVDGLSVWKVCYYSLARAQTVNA